MISYTTADIHNFNYLIDQKSKMSAVVHQLKNSESVNCVCFNLYHDCTIFKLADNNKITN